VEMASGADGDNEEHLETQKLTLMSYNTIQFNVFVVTKYTTLYYFSDAIRGWTLIQDKRKLLSQTFSPSGYLSFHFDLSPSG
jgi:hypothetical protein